MCVYEQIAGIRQNTRSKPLRDRELLLLEIRSTLMKRRCGGRSRFGSAGSWYAERGAPLPIRLTGPRLEFDNSFISTSRLQVWRFTAFPRKEMRCYVDEV
ncbi:hypothetical protein Bbelb_009610 [Branchiostoma belcheri]|nr:hypothetical protein Bbelb_009610 [Branchiostoma belcheri]